MSRAGDTPNTVSGHLGFTSRSQSLNRNALFFLRLGKGALPDVLKVVKLPILSNGECRRMYKAAGYPKSIKSTVVCAGFAAGGKDSCEGDSGGPLMVYSRTRQTWVLAGIVSNGIRCAEPNLPGIYTRPTAYLEWINSVMKGGNELDADKLG